MAPEVSSRTRLLQIESCLQSIAGGDQRPGHVAYLTKVEMARIAENALAFVEVVLADASVPA